MAGNRKAPTGIAALAAAVCLLGVSGCGGGGDDSTTTTTQAATIVPAVTAPPTTSTTGSGGGQAGRARTTTQPAGPGTGTGQRPGALLDALGPFQDCLSRHGVTPEQFRATLGQRFRRGQTGASAGDAGRRIEAGIACIPELPPQLQQQAERLAQRYQQQNG